MLCKLNMKERPKLVTFLMLVIGLAHAAAVAFPLNPSQEDTNARLANIEAVLEVVLAKNIDLEKRAKVLEEEKKMLQESMAEVLQRDAGSKEDAEVFNPDTDEREQGESISESDQTEKVRREIDNTDKGANLWKRQLNSATVAFTAVVGPNRLQNLGQGQTVIYDNVITNIGDAYHNHIGVFVAPVTGVYVFNFAAMLEAGDNLYLNLVKDGQVVMKNYGEAYSGHIVSTSRTATVQVDKGSEVWIRIQDLASYQGSGRIHGNMYTAFSGWLIAVT